MYIKVVLLSKALAELLSSSNTISSVVLGSGIDSLTSREIDRKVIILETMCASYGIPWT